MMNRVVINYSHNMDNDTQIVYSFDENGSHLDCSYTDQDPDYGTDKLEYNSEPMETLHTMASEYLAEISEYLDKTSDGIKRPGDAPRELEMVFGEYSNSALYAIENALRTIVGEPTEMLNKDGNLIQIVTVREAAKIIKDALANGWKDQYQFCLAFSGFEEISAHKLADFADGYHAVLWYGVKRIWNDENLFDGSGFGTDLIMMVGKYGGGNITMAHYWSDEYTNLNEQDPERLIKAICESADATPDEKVLLETIEKKEEK